MSSAIVIRDLEWKYANTEEFALRGINLEIEENSFTGIVGANEQGKTTLVSSINGLIPHSEAGVYRGRVEVFGSEVKEMSALTMATKVGLVFSDPEAQFTAMTVEEEIAFGMENLGFSLEKIQERLDWAAELTMIQDLMDKSPYDISGGQKQRVAIACVLAMNPPIIIMDEPTSMIDPLGKSFIFEILRKLKEEGDHTIIVVEHNIEQLAPLSDNIILMNEGRIDKIAPPAEFFNDPDYLLSRGVQVPQVTEFIEKLKISGEASSDEPVALDLATASAITQRVIESRRAA
jgi:energy-coupling factor transporter ATP-binding protein EcfA2